MSSDVVRNEATVATRHAEWLKLRLRGLTYRQIADRYGVHHGTVHAAVKKALAESIKEPSEEIRQMELARLDGMYEVVLGVLEGHHITVSNGRVMTHDGSPIPDSGPVLAAIDRLLKIQERRAKLLGLDTPAQQNVGLTISYEIPGVDLGELQ